MTFRTLLATTAIACFAAVTQAQTGVPEFKDKVMALNTANQAADLDNTDLQSELNTTMSGKSTVSIKAMGATSAVKSAPAAKFIVRMEPGTDPQAAVELFQFDAEKKVRKIRIAYYVMGKAKDIELPKVKLSFTKVQDGVYSIAPQGNLTAGEYVFIVNRPNIDIMGASSNVRMKGFTFSID